MQRIVAFLILLLPGAMAVIGIKWMRDMLFGILSPFMPSLWLQFMLGLLMTIGGIAFVAGFVLHRDRKRKKVQDRFKQIKAKR